MKSVKCVVLRDDLVGAARDLRQLRPLAARLVEEERDDVAVGHPGRHPTGVDRQRHLHRLLELQAVRPEAQAPRPLPTFSISARSGASWPRSSARIVTRTSLSTAPAGMSIWRARERQRARLDRRHDGAVGRAHVLDRRRHADDAALRRARRTCRRGPCASAALTVLGGDVETDAPRLALGGRGLVDVDLEAPVGVDLSRRPAGRRRRTAACAGGRPSTRSRARRSCGRRHSPCSGYDTAQVRGRRSAGNDWTRASLTCALLSRSPTTRTRSSELGRQDAGDRDRLPARRPPVEVHVHLTLSARPRGRRRTPSACRVPACPSRTTGTPAHGRRRAAGWPRARPVRRDRSRDRRRRATSERPAPAARPTPSGTLTMRTLRML